MTDTLTRAEREHTEREYRFSEARWLMSFHVHPDRIAQQLGVERHNLERQAMRWGAHDVALYVAVRHDKRKRAA